MSGGTALRVPEADGAVLIEPPPDRVRDLLERSPRRREATSELLDAAREYMTRSGEPIPDLSSDLVLMSGHQPELFHPGVWLKNFVLNGLARRHRAHAVNLIVDNDTAKTTSLSRPDVSIPLPPIESRRPGIVDVPIDGTPPGVIHEEWRTADEAMFRDLPSRMGQLPPDCLLPSFWDEVARQDRTHTVPERWSAARRSLERRWGCANLEVPIGVLCRTRAFADFASRILIDLPRFHDVFNRAVRDYRRSHRLRSRHHPFPELARDGDWLEAPFWIRRADAKVRSRLFVRRIDHGLALRLGVEEGPTLSSAHPSRDLLKLEGDGIKLRTRAVTTTLFARLHLADLFLHGIGGAKYDETTDRVIERFYETTPPPFLVVTGTLRLPLPTYPTTTDDLRIQERTRRDLVYNPQRFLKDDDTSRELLMQRRELLTALPTTRRERRERFRMLHRTIERLSSQLAEQLAVVDGSLNRGRLEVEANELLRRRDWAFCLYPEKELRSFLMQ